MWYWLHGSFPCTLCTPTPPVYTHTEAAPSGDGAVPGPGLGPGWASFRSSPAQILLPLAMPNLQAGRSCHSSWELVGKVRTALAWDRRWGRGGEESGWGMGESEGGERRRARGR